ncbi:MAG: TIGR01777 family oxidoreductase [Synechococcaceae cyanobacterium]|nr:TIGR01777 family oxidoreductase [Synechococcaceae cyanobacterium]
MRLLLLGCTGFVGRELVPYLLELGHELTVVSRRSQPFPVPLMQRLTLLQLNPADPASWQREDLHQALATAEGVVNLAGEPIAERRWSEVQRQHLRDSRLVTTRALVEAMAARPQPPKVLVNASAVGFYGTSLEATFGEASPPGDDFLAHLCRDWEEAAHAAPAGCRVVVLRIGIVLGPDGGALGRMLPVFRAGLGGPVGSGRQWMSWIHRHDLCRLIATALEDPAYTGVYNAVAPEPTRMGTFAATLGRTLGRPSLLPVPAPVLQVMLGDGALVVLEGQQVRSDRLQARGFTFHYPDLGAALAAATSPAPH